MPVKQLIVMVEGPSDKYYFEKYLDVVCSNYTCKVYMWNHPNLEGRKTPDTEKIINYINSGIHLRKNDMGDYLFVTDIDASTCVTKKNRKLKKDSKI